MSVYYELNKNLANCEYLISHMALDCPKGASVEGNPHEYKIIVTTIQKLIYLSVKINSMIFIRNMWY